MTNLIENIAEAKAKLIELHVRAKRVQYRNVIPRIAKKEPTDATMIGFNYRLGNWVNGLEKIEKEHDKHSNHIVVAKSDLLEKYLAK